MLKEVINYLNLSAGKTIVDATVGTGGHTEAIIKKIMPQGRLVGIDRDCESLKVVSQRLGELAENCDLIYGNFRDLDKILEGLNIKKIDGILFDLGISSFQLDDAQRGFSFQKDGPLDMRLDRNSYISAYDLVNNLNEDEISSLLWNFGQERWHNRIARFLVRKREKSPIATTTELSNVIVEAIPARYRHYRIHPATRTFQAMRIAVNRELEVLEEAINKAIDLLSRKSRICVISFHSLEDRIVKFTFRKEAASGKIRIITPKPLFPTFEEVRNNPGSRSSKIRVAERI